MNPGVCQDVEGKNSEIKVSCRRESYVGELLFLRVMSKSDTLFDMLQLVVLLCLKTSWRTRDRCENVSAVLSVIFTVKV